MRITRKIEACTLFFDELCEKLSATHVRMESCTKGCSVYLVPIGTEDQVTWHGKPEMSFRVSDHWNWYTNTKKCPNSRYIQCLTRDLPWARNRPEDGKASKPIFAASVALFINGQYTVVYGERFDRSTKEWSWVENSVDNVISAL